jgi:integrase
MRLPKRAGVAISGAHRLRHTFCSHLAMGWCSGESDSGTRRASDVTTTQRYMHLSPAAIEGAIRLLPQVGPAEAGPHVHTARGDILETAEA